jgi:hypothetical protein
VIYFARAGETGTVKIGRAKDIARRLRSLQCGHSAPLVLIRQMDGDSKEEAWLHSHFRQQRVRGEWFKFDPSMLTVVVPALATDIRAPEATRRTKDGVVDSVVAKFGSQVELAGLLGCDQSTISLWKNRSGDLIPARWQREILTLARRIGVTVTPDDFFPRERVA